MAVGGGPGAPGARGWGPLLKATGPAQETSFGPKAENVTVPVGDGAPAAPVTVAVSEIVLPTTAVNFARVAMATVAWVTTDVSLAALQALVTAG